MKIRLSIKNRLSISLYNYRWSDYHSYLNGPIVRASLFIPLVGYMILFNDYVSDKFTFFTLTSQDISGHGLTSKLRLQLLYFGLISLGTANAIYRLRKPYVFNIGANNLDFTRNAFEFFTLTEYVNIHGDIRYHGHRTTDGKYYDSEFDGFLRQCRNEGEGTDNVKQTGNWEAAKAKYGSLLRSMLRECFARRDVERRLSLTIALTFASIGYLFLAVPSLDLFFKVIVTILK